MRTTTKGLWGVAAVLIAVIAQSILQSSTQSSIQSATRNPQSAMPKAGWRSLFDGHSLSAWRGYKSDTVPEGWKIENGTLAKDDRVGDLITRDEFGNFELELEWKIGRAGNSGIFYRGIEDPDYGGAPND